MLGGENMKMKFYSTHCPSCIVLEKMLKKESIDFELITDEKIILKVAKENKIMSAPFAKIDGKILDRSEIVKYIMERKKNEK